MINISEIIQSVFSQTGNAFFYTPPYYKNSESYLFRNSKSIISISEPSMIEKQLNEVDKRKTSGELFYASLNYELGHCFEEKLHKYLKNHEMEFGTYNFFNSSDVQKIKSDEIIIDVIYDGANSMIADFNITTEKTKFISDIGRIKMYIASGQTYQVNYTTSATFKLICSLELLIASMIYNQTAQYIAIINDGERITISISPELFYKIEGKTITSKPMKGTIRRGINLSNDYESLQQLKSSKKDHAENVMIIDLIRNDLGRICEYNSVQNTSQFDVEKYESVYQLTSTVSGELKSNSTYHILKNIFPCGSITGAPKIRTMEIINELESRKRGIYTGAIGFFNGEQTVFNVPIRTVEIDVKLKEGRIGIGSGVVWDSDAQAEYDECKSKAAFITNPQPYFELIETMLVENGDIFLLKYHLQRLKDSANYFLFIYDEEQIRNDLYLVLQASEQTNRFKIRLLLNKWGKLNISSSKLIEINSSRVIIAENRINSRHKFQYFKTTNRNVYNDAAKFACKNGFYDTIFLNEKDEIAEGAITNVFVKRKDKLITPPIEAGILNGCYRQYLIDNNEVEEDIIKLEELQKLENFYLGNSVNKLVRVTL